VHIIPAKIHFVWLGSGIPRIYEALVQRWMDLHPGWQVRIWGEAQIRELMVAMGTGLALRFNQPDLPFSTKSDLARFHIVAHEGGIYSDTDFLLLRSLDSVRDCTLFGVHEREGIICSGVFGAVQGHSLFPKIFEHLRQADYSLPANLVAGPTMFTGFCSEAALRDQNSKLLPPASFFPVGFGVKSDQSAWLNCDLSQSYGAHLWAHSWSPNGGADDKTLWARIGAIFMNRSRGAAKTP
jgi:mannosyltransferase OCH1-like enzyme